MYAGITLNAKTNNVAGVIQAFITLMQNEFLATVDDGKTQSADVTCHTATAFWGNLNSCYEITLTTNHAEDTIIISAWGDAREMDTDEMVLKLQALAPFIEPGTIEATAQENEAEADSDDDAIETFTLNIPWA